MIKKSRFVPCKWGKNTHIQTLWPTVMRSQMHFSYHSQRINTEDGDFLDLAWSAIPVGNDPGPILILFHGLEGSVDSPYIKGLFTIARSEGWIAVMMHYRGCSGEPNRRIRSYHSGETSDADFLIRYLRNRLPSAQLFAIGFSLGGNMLLKYLGEKREKNVIKAAIAVSVPFELEQCAAKLETGFSRVYQRHLLFSLKNNIKRKMTLMDYSGVVRLNSDDIDKLKTFRDYDEHITAPIHGFKGAEDYYQQCSSRQYLKHITKSTLIIQAADDPFLPKEALPAADELSEEVTLELSEQGGHVGFISGGSPCNPQYWLEERIPAYIRDHLAYRFV